MTSNFFNLSKVSKNVTVIQNQTLTQTLTLIQCQILTLTLTLNLIRCLWIYSSLFSLICIYTLLNKLVDNCFFPSHNRINSYAGYASAMHPFFWYFQYLKYHWNQSQGSISLIQTLSSQNLSDVPHLTPYFLTLTS